jgi:hypothetical protein
MFLIALLALGASYLALRELRLRGEFLALPQAVQGNAESMRRRLGEVERFVEHHPLWLGALRALGERTELRLKIALLAERDRLEREATERAERERLESAELCRARGLMHVQSGDLRRALESFREALAYGGPEWPAFEQVSRDADTLEKGLSEFP